MLIPMVLYRWRSWGSCARRRCGGTWGASSATWTRTRTSTSPPRPAPRPPHTPSRAALAEVCGYARDGGPAKRTRAHIGGEAEARRASHERGCHGAPTIGRPANRTRAHAHTDRWAELSTSITSGRGPSAALSGEFEGTEGAGGRRVCLPGALWAL